MVEKKGDLFTCATDGALAHCISRDCKMTKGIAKLFKKHFSSIKLIKKDSSDVGSIIVTKENERFIYNLVTKEKYFQKPTYRAEWILYIINR